MLEPSGQLVGRSKQPVWVGAIKIDVHINHFRLHPQAKGHAFGMSLVD